MFCLINFLAAAVLGVVDSLLGLKISDIGILSSIYYLAVLIPSLAVCVRRLHDVGKSGWMYFIILIPIVGFIWLLVLFCTDSQAGTNEWGENPKQL